MLDSIPSSAKVALSASLQETLAFVCAHGSLAALFRLQAFMADQCVSIIQFEKEARQAVGSQQRVQHELAQAQLVAMRQPIGSQEPTPAQLGAMQSGRVVQADDGPIDRLSPLPHAQRQDRPYGVEH